MQVDFLPLVVYIKTIQIPKSLDDTTWHKLFAAKSKTLSIDSQIGFSTSRVATPTFPPNKKTASILTFS